MPIAQTQLADCFQTIHDESMADPSPEPPQPLVAILLCTYNGEGFLSEQLDSITSQTHHNLKLWVSDDGSQDRTANILTEYRASWPGDCFSILPGPRQGFAQNFLSLTCNPVIQADYFAWADQDDIWEPDKLTRALTKLEGIPVNIPVLYCSRTITINRHGDRVGLSPLLNKPPGFANALVQNIGGGNTMVMNRAARELLIAAGSLPVVAHDWWLYQLVSGAGGRVFYDPTPSIRYRQHSDNQVGCNTGWLARLHRIRLLLKGRFRDWNTINTQALIENRELLTAVNQRILDQFCTGRNRWLLPRLRGL